MEAEISQQARSLATMYFESFCVAQTMQEILSIHREMNSLANMQPARFTEYFPRIKALLSNSWRAQALFKKIEVRANLKEYKKNKACSSNRVLISGAGPAGLIMAVECQLLGAKVVVLEKRDKFSRNNVVHLWDFLIADLISLGAKTFHGKFCGGSINHISIRQLQCILLKMVLLLGVEVHEAVTFVDIIKPEKLTENEAIGWRAKLEPSDHPASVYEFDALVGADGRRNSLRGFQKKELRTKQCIGITVNFLNRNTEVDAAATEIGGVSYVFAQQFFDYMKTSKNIDLENITYYKDETHYFVMTAKKQNLLEKGVLIKDHKSVSDLLSKENVSKRALMDYALEAAQAATDGQLSNITFALNHCGEPDVAIFDFSTSFISENASIMYEMYGKRLLCQLIGDSLLEPFWPTGSGCARCFLSAKDAAWAIRAFGVRPEIHPLEIIAERESVYRILPQAITNTLQANIAGYTIDPSTRYINLNKTWVLPNAVNRLYLSDNIVEISDNKKHSLQRAMKTEPLPADYLVKWAGYDDLQKATSCEGLWGIVKKYRPDLLPEEKEENYKKIYKLLTQKFDLKPYNDAKSHKYLMAVYKVFNGEIPYIQYKTDILSQLPLPIPAHAMYFNAEEKSPQPVAPKKKGFSVSIETADFIRKQIGKLDLNDITRLAHLMEGHDAISDSENSFKQTEIQKKIIAFLDPDESADPTTVREAITGLLEGSAKININTTEQSHVAKYFVTEERKGPEEKRKRHLKGLDPDSIKVSDFSFEDSDTNVEATLNLLKDEQKPIKKLVRSYSDECGDSSKPLDLSNRRKNSDSMLHSVVSNSFGSSEMGRGIKEMTDLFERQVNLNLQSKRSVFTPNEDHRLDRNPRWQHVVDIMEGKQQDVSNSDPKKVETVGNVEVAERRQKIAELLLGMPREATPGTSYRRNAGEMASRMQRVTDMMAKKNSETSRPKISMNRRKVREMVKDRMERSLHLLSLEPPPRSSHTDLDHDYDLQKYRAEAPEFDERVKKLERQLQHYVRSGESAIEPMKASGGGMRVAKLAAELNSPALPTAKSMKPKDLLRSIGKISQEDWQVKQIERKISENRLGRPVPSVAQHVPKWDREQFLKRRKNIQSTDKPAEVDKGDKEIPAKGNVEKLVQHFIESPVRKIEPKFHASRAIAREEVKQPWRGYISLSDSSIDTKPVCGLNRHPNELLRGAPTCVLPEKIFVDLTDTGEFEERALMKFNNISQPSSIYGYSVTDKQKDEAGWCPPKLDQRHKDQATSSYDGSASSMGSAVFNKPRDVKPKKREAAAKKEVSTTETESESDEEESDSSDDEQSSATGVSTDSEFACEESTVNLSPPEILVTEAPPNIVSPSQDYPLSRAKSAGGLATKRALELKRKYLLGEPSPPAVRKSDSTSQIDTKLEAFCLNITEFQKMLNPATPTPQTGATSIFSYQFPLEEKKQPDIPDIIKNICNNVPIDLLTKGDSIISWYKQEEKDPDLETDSLSDESCSSDTAPNQSVPRVEVHDEGGELIQLDSLILISNEVDDVSEKLTRAATSSEPTMVAAESESSESSKDVTTCAPTETELSDWAAESVVVDECGVDVNGERKRNKNPRILSGPKSIHDAVNIESIPSHVCGRDGSKSELVVYSNAPEYFEFADEGDQDPTILSTPCNEGYMELVDDYSMSKDRSINFIERVCSDTTVKPDANDALDMVASKFSDTLEYIVSQESTSDSVINTEKVSNRILSSCENTNFGTNATNVSNNSSVNISKNVDYGTYDSINDTKICMESLDSIEESPPLLSSTDRKDASISDSTTKNRQFLEHISPPLLSDGMSHAYSLTKISPIHGEKLKKMRNYSPAICRSVSETFCGSRSSTIDTSHDNDWMMIPLSCKDLAAGDSHHPVSSQTSKVQELKRERDEQTEVVRRLVLERLGGAKVNRKASRRNRVIPSSIAPPPVPPPPLLPALILPFPEVPPRPSLQPRLSLAAQTSFSDPELNREQRPSKSFFKSISNYFNKRLGPKCKGLPSLRERAPAVPALIDIKTTRGGTLPKQKTLVSRSSSALNPEKAHLLRLSRLEEFKSKLNKATSSVERARIMANIAEINNLIASSGYVNAAAAHMMRATRGSVGD